MKKFAETDNIFKNHSNIPVLMVQEVIVELQINMQLNCQIICLNFTMISVNPAWHYTQLQNYEIKIK